jgi:hypothetical protein
MRPRRVQAAAHLVYGRQMKKTDVSACPNLHSP